MREKLNSTSIIKKNGDKLDFDSKSKIGNKNKNDRQCNISKSLSVINKNNNSKTIQNMIIKEFF